MQSTVHSKNCPKLSLPLFAVYLFNTTMNHLCVFSDHCLASALEQLSINAIIIAQSHSFHTKRDKTWTETKKKRNKRGNKNVERITRKEHHQKKFCFMFWWIVGFDITQIIIQLLEKIEYFSTLPLTSYCPLLVVVMHTEIVPKIRCESQVFKKSG